MKKGFTLIELLAVIVILAIIALIATPIVLNIINDTKESAVIRSADFYIDALENEIMLENMKQGGNFNPNICTVTNKVITCDGKEINLKVDGEVPTSGSITFEEGKVKDVNLTYQNGTVTLNNKGELVLGEVEIVLAPGLYDENDKLLASWEELNNIVLEETEKQYDLKAIIEQDYPSFRMSTLMSNFETASKLVIDESVTSIGAEAIALCSNLKEITIPNSITSIGDYAFGGTDLEKITIPESVTSVGESICISCASLTSIVVDENNPVYDSRDNSNAIIETATNTLVVGCKNTVIRNSVTSIGPNAFRNCTGLTSITIPNSVTSIENSAFEACSGLTSVTIGSGVTSIGHGAFSGCSSLTSITIPNSVTSIDIYAFYGCTSLASIVVDENNPVYDSRDNSNAIIETSTNKLVYGCKNTVIPNSVTSIEDYAFYGSTSLTSITIPNSVTSIGADAFSGCTSLTTIYYKGTATGSPWGAPNAKLETNF